MIVTLCRSNCVNTFVLLCICLLVDRQDVEGERVHVR